MTVLATLRKPAARGQRGYSPRVVEILATELSELFPLVLATVIMPCWVEILQRRKQMITGKHPSMRIRPR